ncbi:MAG: glycosyltransferase [Solirubrobacterales bacterium]
MTRMAPTCAVVIPTYEGALLTRACLKALLEHPPARCRMRVVVVDDASSDGTRELLEQEYGAAVTAVIHERNRGFAVSCNDGARAAGDCEYLVFLNNDTIPTAGWLDALMDLAARTPAAAAVGAKLLFPNGTIQHAGVTISRDGWPRHLYAGFPGEHPAVNRSRAVAAATGACLLVRSEDFEQLGGFDSAFHNGYEDVDLCLRLGQRGREVWYCHDSVVYHLESVTRWPTGRAQDLEGNERLYDERWRGRVAPDDVQHYLDDGLLELEYGSSYPLTVAVAPDLGVVRSDSEELAGLERSLSARSRQVMEMQAALTRAMLNGGGGQPSALNGGARARATPRVLARGGIHRLDDGGAERLVSLVLPVKNQERDVRELLPLVLAQRANARLEIVAVDSGSRDGTVAALAQAGATVVAIDPADFDHGLTRNLAVEHAAGEVLVFLSGRSRPAGANWLAPLLSVLDEDPHAAGVCSRVLPRPDADPLSVRDGERELSGSSERTRKAIEDWESYRALGASERRVLLNFHTVGAALRRDVFDQIEFRSVATLGEDLLWAREVLEAGWSLWHEPASVVYHSHDYTLRELFARNVDDGVANREINERALAEGEVAPLIEALVADDWVYLRDQLGLEEEELDRRRLESALRRVAQVVGQWVGVNHRELPEGMATYFSGVRRARASVTPGSAVAGRAAQESVPDSTVPGSAEAK